VRALGQPTSRLKVPLVTVVVPRLFAVSTAAVIVGVVEQRHRRAVSPLP